MKRSIRALILLLSLAAAPAFSQVRQPAAYVLSAGD